MLRKKLLLLLSLLVVFVCTSVAIAWAHSLPALGEWSNSDDPAPEEIPPPDTIEVGPEPANNTAPTYQNEDAAPNMN